MKTTYADLPVQENWNGHKHQLQCLFIWLTGYEIMFEGSRRDLMVEITQKYIGANNKINQF